MAPTSTDFYVRYYVGHKGKFGHEFLEFEFRPDGQVRGAALLMKVLKDNIYTFCRISMHGGP